MGLTLLALLLTACSEPPRIAPGRVLLVGVGIALVPAWLRLGFT